MKIDKVDNVKFEAGKINLKRVSADNITSYEAIKNIAEDKGMDIFISKNKKSKYLPRENMFLVLAYKDRPVVERNFFQVGTQTSHAVSCFIANKNIKNEELGVRIYNATMSAIEALEAKLGLNRKHP
ncbi:MAG: hypothetical protein K6E29_02305 [Cyanobacteria bacterium RUI128]|nr:hypothetical protein [Cyanobacteria bacterium RUI128]